MTEGVTSEPQYQLLIVEDDDDSREMLVQLAGLYGYRALGAATAKAALEYARRHMPKLALVDIGLTETDGFEVARKLRGTPGGERVRLVALTGYSDAEYRTRAEASGFDEFVVKPLMADRLSELLSRWVGTE